MARGRLTSPRISRSWLAGVAIAVTTNCYSAPELHRQQAFILGTVVEISGVGVEKEVFTTAADAAFRAMRRIHRRLHPDDPGSVLRAFNESAQRQWQELVPPLNHLLPRALALQQASGGIFNPALGQLIEVWGLGAPPFPKAPPKPSELVELLPERPKTPAVQLRRKGGHLQGRITLLGAALDLGGIAKGFAVDQAIAALRRNGVHNALVNAGGDLRVIGKYGDRPWQVGIRYPGRDQGVIAVVELASGEAVATSGSYERYFDYQGTRYHHLLDPTTGQPARGIRSATVIGPRATETDAWATALFVSGGLEELTLGEQPALVIDTQGHIHTNGPIQACLEWQTATPPDPK